MDSTHASPTVFITGASTLQRFTSGILREGFKNRGWHVVDDLSQASYCLFQLHGSPHAEQQDRALLDEFVSAQAHVYAGILLLHRPDELQDRILALQEILPVLSPHIGITMLGDGCLSDQIFADIRHRSMVIPHGFFSKRLPSQFSPVVVGSHTTWGEMRSLPQAHELVARVLRIASKRGVPIIGYLGGGPRDQWDSELDEQTLLDGEINTLQIPADFQLSHSPALSRPTLLLNPSMNPPSNFDMTFNIQLYHYQQTVRRGESSGSVHASSGIPVIFEMNGAERIEELPVVRVPYADPKSIESADLEAAAETIVNLVASREYVGMLGDIEKSAQQWSASAVAQRYIEFLTALSQKK